MDQKEKKGKNRQKDEGNETGETLRNSKFQFPGQRIPLIYSSHLLVIPQETCHQGKVPTGEKRASVIPNFQDSENGPR